MSQPVWKTLHSLGDIGCIYEDETGVYSPEAEIWQEYSPGRHEAFSDDPCDSRADDESDDYWCRCTRAQHSWAAGGTAEAVSPQACRNFTVDWRERKRFYVYRVVLDKFDAEQLPDGKTGVGEWFDDRLDSVAASNGITREALVASLCSANPVKRFGAYYALGSYFGWDEFDSSPLDLSESELDERIDAHDAAERVRDAERDAQRRIARVARIATAPHARCVRSETCLEHAQDPSVQSCKPGRRGKGRRRP